jgi:hypothetical protein
VDRAKGIRPSNKWEIEKNEETIKDCKSRSRKNWECSNKIDWCMDEFGEIESEVGTTL